MRTEEVVVPADAELGAAERGVERCCEALGLRVTLKGTAVAYPGSVHWHLKRGKERGTLEVTFWPVRRRLWISVHENRAASWIEDALPRLKEALGGAMRGKTSPQV